MYHDVSLVRLKCCSEVFYSVSFFFSSYSDVFHVPICLKQLFHTLYQKCFITCFDRVSDFSVLKPFLTRGAITPDFYSDVFMFQYIQNYCFIQCIKMFQYMF